MHKNKIVADVTDSQKVPVLDSEDSEVVVLKRYDQVIRELHKNGLP